jgi:hypothetical protein
MTLRRSRRSCTLPEPMNTPSQVILMLAGNSGHTAPVDPRSSISITRKVTREVPSLYLDPTVLLARPRPCNLGGEHPRCQWLCDDVYSPDEHDRGAPLSTPIAAAPAASPSAAALPAVASSPIGAAPAASSPVLSSPSPKVNANTATSEQIQAALEAGGVPNAARWTREVIEYRPYPANDPSWAKLRQELAKYNPSSDVVDKIVAVLTT